MAQYVCSLASFSTCSIPGREVVCLSLALVGFLCLAVAAKVSLRGVEEGGFSLNLE